MGSGTWVAWIGATLWFGAAGLRLIVAEPEDARLNRMGMIRAFHQSIAAIRAGLWIVSWAGTSLVLAGTVGEIALVGHATLAELISVAAAGLALVGIMFHVEHLAAPHGRGEMHIQQIFVGILAIFSMITLCLVARDLARLVVGRGTPGPLWGVFAAGGALLGAALASVALARPIMRHDSPQIEVILAVIGSRWATFSGSLAAFALAVIIIWGRIAPIGSPNMTMALDSIAALPLLAIILLRMTALRRLWRSALALPLAGFPERSLRARWARTHRWAYFVIGWGLGCLLLTVGAAAPLVAVAAQSASLPPLIATIRSTPTLTPHPILPTLPPSAGTPQAGGQNDGVRVMLSDPAFTVGMLTLHVTVTDGQGQPIAGAHLTLVLSPTHSTTAGAVVDTTADPSGNPTSFLANVTFSEAGAWEVVALVATDDQSIEASVTFTIMVA